MWSAIGVKNNLCVTGFLSWQAARRACRINFEVTG